MVNTRSRYPPPMIRAARQVLLELAFVLRDDLPHLVFVGGMACTLLFDQDADPHEGTIDINLALDADALADGDDETLEDKLLTALYQQDAPKRKCRWVRSVSLDDHTTEIAVDLLTGEYQDIRPHPPSREVQGLFASVLRGMELAFLQPTPVPLTKTLPHGQPYEVTILVCSAPSLLAMKGIAIQERTQGADKDATDIDYLLRRFPGGPDALARIFQTDYYAHNELAHEGLGGIAAAFQTVDALGPQSVAGADRYANLDDEDRAVIQQSAFQRAQRLLRAFASP